MVKFQSILPIIGTLLFVITIAPFSSAKSDLDTVVTQKNTEDVLKSIETSKFTSITHKIFRGLPRYNLQFKKISNEWNPKDNDYYESLGIIASIFVICAILCFLGAIAAVCIKCCMLCCNKKRKNIKKSHVLFTKAKIMVVIIFLVASSAILLLATLSIHESFDSSLQTFSETISAMFSDVHDISSILNEFNETSTLTLRNEISSFIQQSNSTMTDAQTYQQMGHKYEYYREISMFAVCGLSVLFCFIALLSICFSSRPTSYCNSLWILIYISLLWLLIAVYFPTGTFISDMCPAIETYITNSSSSSQSEYKWINYYLECDPNSEMYENPLANASMLVVKEIVLIQNEITYARNHNMSSQIIDPLLALIAELNNLQLKLDDLSNCTTTQEAWTEIKTYICGDVVNGIALTILSLAFASLLFPILAHFGFQLFDRLAKTHHHHHGEYEKLEEIEIQSEEHGDSKETTVLLASFREGPPEYTASTVTRTFNVVPLNASSSSFVERTTTSSSYPSAPSLNFGSDDLRSLDDLS